VGLDDGRNVSGIWEIPPDVLVSGDSSAAVGMGSGFSGAFGGSGCRCREMVVGRAFGIRPLGGASGVFPLAGGDGRRLYEVRETLSSLAGGRHVLWPAGGVRGGFPHRCLGKHRDRPGE